MNATPTRRPKVLLVDDDPVVLRLLANALLARGFEVLAAADAAAGLELLLEELLDLDVLVADRDLPGRDGAALTRLVRDAGGERDLGLVLLADGPSASTRAWLVSLGADVVLDRSVGPAALADAIAGVARVAPPARAWLAAGAALRGAFDAVRAAAAPAARLARSPA
jgi:DNA-binding response OmpR family regulator